VSVRRVVGAAAVACLAACGSTVRLPSLQTGTASPAPLCGPSGDWTASTLAAAILPADAAPTPLAAHGDRAPTLADEQGSEPAVIADALTGFTAGYRRDWVAPKVAAGFVQLWAFGTEVQATDFQAALVAYFSGGNGATGTPIDAIPTATEYLNHGPSGDSHDLVAERDRVVMEIGIGGPGITDSTIEDLGRLQYDRLCRS
jgi:hypothetical protein